MSIIVIMLLGLCCTCRGKWFAHDRAAYDAQNQNWAQALTRLNTSLIGQPDDPSLLYDAGVVAYKSGDQKQAQDYFKRAVQAPSIEPLLQKQAYFNLGNSHIAFKEYKEAVAAYEQALKLDPSDEHVRHNLKKARELLAQQEKEKQQEKNQQEQQKQDQNKSQDKDQQQDNKQDQQDKDDQQNEQKQHQDKQDQQGNENKAASGTQEQKNKGSQQSDEQKQGAGSKGQQSKKNEQESGQAGSDQRKEQQEGGGQEPDNKKGEQPGDGEQGQAGQGQSPEQKQSGNKGPGTQGVSPEQLPGEQEQSSLTEAQQSGQQKGSKKEDTQSATPAAEPMQVQQGHQVQAGGPDNKKIDKRLIWIMDEQERQDAQRSKGLIKGVIGKQLVGQDGQHCW